ncbi:glutamate--cysteine ligase [Streptomyces sp. ISL-11]|uniref:carboxylate-amine ligase n=1 Tax=Streptomyces sp. ISL-11 TaxID=2819174 RepID=UPI001BE8B195|nr:glutamate--cysteine ligase [Streptomyces sp. ISL-11]MBT2383925.1 glutamate--cysteine ligase [Streptomyces sp. ISL-11]
MRTLGVEEEYLLLDPHSGLPVPLAEKVRAAAGPRPLRAEGELHSELLQSQIEVATAVCGDLGELEEHLLRLRRAVGEAAAGAGCRVAASGTAPFAGPVPPAVTDDRRYRGIHADAPQLVDEQLINGMHVHVGIADRATGVAVLNRIRPWLPVLVAMASNSPMWTGHDTGFASWRTVVFGRWPVSGPPPAFEDAEDYDRRVRALMRTRILRDRGQLYWQARLSERYPTVEVRALDVQLRTGDAVMFAGLVRALVDTALEESERAAPFPVPAPELLATANWHAARHGLSGELLDERGGRRPAGEVVGRLVDHLSPALERSDGGGEVAAFAGRLQERGTAADHQRAALAEGGWRAVLELITTLT